jgi:hypothetical protein
MIMKEDLTRTGREFLTSRATEMLLSLDKVLHMRHSHFASSLSSLLTVAFISSQTTKLDSLLILKMAEVSLSLLIL